MNAPRKRVPSRSHGTAELSGKSKGAQPDQKESTVAALPELEPIFNAISEAHAVVHSASYVLHDDSRGDGDELFALIALRHGVTTLGTAVDRLQEAEDVVSHFREQAGGVS